MLADQIDALLKESQSSDEQAVIEPQFQNPDATLFRVGKFGLQYDPDLHLIDVEVAEMLGIDQGTPEVLHLWVNQSQLGWLADHARTVARSGLAATES